MNLTKNQVVIIGVVGLVILILILVFFGILPGLKKEDPKTSIKTNLEFWGVFDSLESYNSALAAYKAVYPGITVNYRRFTDAVGYEQVLLDALAAGEGPDIFMMRNQALPRDINKIVPVTQTKFSILGLRNLFPQVVESDFVSSGSVYALPLSIDTLALYYNREHLDQAAITSPPSTWEEFEETVPKLVKKDGDEITRAAAAIGGSLDSMENAPDVLSLLMLQAGTKMVSDDFTRAEFATRRGEDALEFYVKFSDPESEVYTWNDSMKNPVDAFAEGDASMIFGYASMAPRIWAKNPFLNFAISDMLQPEQAEKTIAYPGYWGYAVSRQSKKQNLAWDFILTLTTNKNNAKSYLERINRPPALRSLIGEKSDDPELNVFARQALIARSWHQADPDAVSGIFSDMISSVASGNIKVGDALDKAEREITSLMRRRF